jgi:hypothetical protein
MHGPFAQSYSLAGFHINTIRTADEISLSIARLDDMSIPESGDALGIHGVLKMASPLSGIALSTKKD